MPAENSTASRSEIVRMGHWVWANVLTNPEFKHCSWGWRNAWWVLGFLAGFTVWLFPFPFDLTLTFDVRVDQVFQLEKTDTIVIAARFTGSQNYYYRFPLVPYQMALQFQPAKENDKLSLQLGQQYRLTLTGQGAYGFLFRDLSPTHTGNQAAGMNAERFPDAVPAVIAARDLPSVLPLAWKEWLWWYRAQMLVAIATLTAIAVRVSQTFWAPAPSAGRADADVPGTPQLAAA